MTGKKDKNLNDRRALRAKNGKCVECKQPTDYYRCDTCTVKRNLYRKSLYLKFKEDGKCVICGREAMAKTQKCEKHYLMSIAATSLSSAAMWKDLKDLMAQQEYKCAMTGLPITFEAQIDLDHILPVSRGGTDTIDNVRWVLSEANMLKSDRTDEELLIYCKLIIKTLKHGAK